MPTYERRGDEVVGQRQGEGAERGGRGEPCLLPLRVR